MNLRCSDLPTVPRCMTLMTSPPLTVAVWENNDHRSAGFKSLVSGFSMLPISTYIPISPMYATSNYFSNIIGEIVE